MFLNQLQTFAFETAKIIIPLRTFVATFAYLFGKYLFPLQPTPFFQLNYVPKCQTLPAVTDSLQTACNLRHHTLHRACLVWV